MALTSSLAAYRPLGAQTEPKMKSHDIVCLHTMVGYLKSTDAMFKSAAYGGTESHFGVGGVWGSDKAYNLDGVIWQWQDLLYQADANLDGNHRVISIETADNAPASANDLTGWSVKQQTAIITLLKQICSKDFHKNCPTSWKCHQVGIPVTLIPDTKPGRRGIAYHRQGVKHSAGLGVEDYLVAGGEKWSTATGKMCPGDARVKQLKNIIIPSLQPAPAKPAVPTTKKEPTMIILATETGQYTYDGGSAPVGIGDPVLARKLRTVVPVVQVTNADKDRLVKQHVAADKALVTAVTAALAPIITREGANPAELQTAVSDAIASALADLVPPVIEEPAAPASS